MARLLHVSRRDVCRVSSTSWRTGVPLVSVPVLKEELVSAHTSFVLLGFNSLLNNETKRWMGSIIPNEYRGPLSSCASSASTGNLRPLRPTSRVHQRSNERYGPFGRGSGQTRGIPAEAGFLFLYCLYCRSFFISSRVEPVCIVLLLRSTILDLMGFEALNY